MTAKIQTRPAPKAAPPKTTKLDRLVAILKRAEGADMPAMIQATAWQAHSIRGALAGALRKKGHNVSSEKLEGGRVWRITSPEAQ